MTTLKRNPALVKYAASMTHEDEVAVCASKAYLRLIGYGHKHPSAKVAALLEVHTKGQFKREELRDDWAQIWPELIDMKRI